jgi:hypothetical protein
VAVTIIKAAAIVARMAAFVSVESALLKHICLAGNSDRRVLACVRRWIERQERQDDAER